MKVHFYATLRSIVGQKTVELDAKPGITARELVALVVQQYPALRVELLDENNEFHRHQKFFINGREAIYLEDKMDTPIQADDKVDIFPPVGGG
jgi:molybdopterin synthase sulfur carrier subunit